MNEETFFDELIGSLDDRIDSQEDKKYDDSFFSALKAYKDSDEVPDEQKDVIRDKLKDLQARQKRSVSRQTYKLKSDLNKPNDSLDSTIPEIEDLDREIDRVSSMLKETKIRLDEISYDTNREEIEGDLHSIIEKFLIGFIRDNKLSFSKDEGMGLLGLLKKEFLSAFEKQYPGSNINVSNSGSFLDVARRFFAEDRVAKNLMDYINKDSKATERLGPVGAAEILGDLRKNRTRKIKTQDIVSSQPDVQDLVKAKQRPQILEPEDIDVEREDPQDRPKTITMPAKSKQQRRQLGLDAEEPSQEEQPTQEEEPEEELPQEEQPPPEEEIQEAEPELEEIKRAVKAGNYQGQNFLKAPGRVSSAKAIEDYISQNLEKDNHRFLSVGGREDISSDDKINPASSQALPKYQRNMLKLFSGILQHSRPYDNEMRDVSYKMAAFFMERMLKMTEGLSVSDYHMGSKTILSDVLKTALSIDMEMAYIVDLFGRAFPYAFSEKDPQETDLFLSVTERDVENWFRTTSNRLSLRTGLPREQVRKVQERMRQVVQDNFLTPEGKQKSERGEPVSVEDIKEANPSEMKEQFDNSIGQMPEIRQLSYEEVESFITDSFDAVVQNNLKDANNEYSVNIDEVILTEVQDEALRKYIEEAIFTKDDIILSDSEIESLLDDIAEESGVESGFEFIEIDEEEIAIIVNGIMLVTLFRLEDLKEEGILDEENLVEQGKDIVDNYIKQFSEQEVEA